MIASLEDISSQLANSTLALAAHELKAGSTHRLMDDPDVDPTDPTVDPETEETYSMEFYAILFGTMLFFFVTAAANEKFKPRVGHQTSYTIILGVIIALILYAAFGASRASQYRFN